MDEVPIPARLHIVARELDPDYLLVGVSIADGQFAGSTEVYENLDLPQSLANALSGFPARPDDRREIVLGDFSPTTAGGAIRLVFRCVDRAGHAIVEGELEDQPRDGSGPRRVTVRLPVSAAGIDRFVADLQRWKVPEGGQATLRVSSRGHR